jgi:hypothetical protein
MWPCTLFAMWSPTLIWSTGLVLPSARRTQEDLGVAGEAVTGRADRFVAECSGGETECEAGGPGHGGAGGPDSEQVLPHWVR